MGVRALAIVSLLSVAAGCADDAACPTAQFALTGPAGFAQLTPGGSVTIAWSFDGDPAATVALRVAATDGVADIALPSAVQGTGELTWNGRDGAGALAPPANYRIGGEVTAAGGCGDATVVPDDLHLIVVQGVRLPTAAIAFTGAQATRMITVTTVTRSMVQLTLGLDPDAGVDGDELAIFEATIPGEFTPTAHSYPFIGMTTAGSPIPAGTYDLIANFAGARTIGPRLTWTP